MTDTTNTEAEMTPTPKENTMTTTTPTIDSPPTADTIDDETIRVLRAEALRAGDRAMAAICDRALRGGRAARAECARVIAEARAQA